MAKSADEHERAAGRIIENALKVPLHELLTNSGENPYEVIPASNGEGTASASMYLDAR